MTKKEQNKCYTLAKKLKKDNYKISFIKNNDSLKYIAIEIEGRKILIDYNGMDGDYHGCYQIGQIFPHNNYEYNEKGIHSRMEVGYSYLFRLYNKEIILNYCNSIDLSEDDLFFPGLAGGYIIDSSIYQQAFNCWMKSNNLKEEHILND